MKKRNIRVFLWGIIQLCLSAFFFYGASSANRDLKSQTPDAVELYDIQGMEVSMAQAAPAAQWAKFAAASLGEEVQASDLAESKSIAAYCQATTPNYGAYLNLHFSEGGYFSAGAGAGNAAVIPESLAKELFAENLTAETTATGTPTENLATETTAEKPATKTLTETLAMETTVENLSGELPMAKGEEKILLINGKEFMVCGVYKDGGILARLGSGKLPVIYSNAPESPDALAEHLLIEADAGKTALQQKQETAVALEIPLGGEMHDFGRLHQLGDGILLLGFFFAGLWFVLRLCIVSYRKLISAYECEGDTAKKCLAASFGIGAFLLAALGFWLLCQLVRIPALYLPKDNIFDISYYGQEILEGIQQIHTDCRIHDFSRICAVYLFAETMLLLPAVPLFWAGCQKLRFCVLLLFRHGDIINENKKECPISSGGQCKEQRGEGT